MNESKTMLNPRFKEFASRQIMEENNLMQAEHLSKMLQDEDTVIKYAKRFIASDLKEIHSEIRQIDKEMDKVAKFEEIENLIFDFGTRIPDIIELLKLEK